MPRKSIQQEIERASIEVAAHLTDEICEQIACTGTLPPPLTDEKYCDIAGSMRAAADWQLDRDSEWLRKFLTGSGAFTYGMANSIVEEFRKAMRPQQQE